MRLLLAFAALATTANAYFLFGMKNILTTERMDPIVNPGKQSSHSHNVVGGSNFRLNTSTAFLRQSACTTSPIVEDKSAYWFPNLYFQWKNGSFSSVDGGVVIYYLFSDKPGVTTPFPDDFRMISGDPNLRTYDPNSFAQQAVTFLCLNFSGKSVRYNELPPVACPSGIRAQINFPSCWDGKNVDSPDHKSHVAFRSGGPDKGSCSDPNFPFTMARIFLEVYLSTGKFDALRSQAMNPNQPYVYSNGDPTGLGLHADFFNGWQPGVLQRVVDKCNCNPFGGASCCANQGLFTLQKEGHCRITKTFDEQITGTLPKLPGNNPVQPAGTRATAYPNDVVPPRIDPVFAYTGDTPTATGRVVSPGSNTTTQAPATPSKGAVRIAEPSPSPSQAPKDKEQTPKDKEQTPKDKEQTPKDKEQTPKDKEQVPKEKEQTPKEKERTPCTPPKKKKKHHHHRRLLNAAHGDLTFV